MGLADIVRSGVAVANGLTASLQVEVIHKAWIGDGASGGRSKPQYAAGIARQAIVEKKQRLLRGTNGREVLQQSAVTFVGPVEPNGAAERREPVDPRDIIVLPDGTTGPILDVQGLVDPATNAPYLIEVALG